MSDPQNATVNPQEENVLEVAGILGVTPDEAAALTPSEVALALGLLKSQENDPTANTSLLTDASRIA